MSGWHQDELPQPKGPSTREDFYQAILEEVKGKLSERQLDGLAEHRYGRPHVGVLDLQDLQDLLRFLRKWALEQRVTDQAAAEQRKANKSRGAS